MGGKQELVTDIKCVNVAGEALVHLLIFKDNDVNTRWINNQLALNWHFAISKNGWTSNDLGLEWLKRVFDLLTREKDAERQRSLITDGHGSLRVDFIAYCIENNLDLLILPAHCSHIPSMGDNCSA
jgi:hypothetical protein